MKKLRIFTLALLLPAFVMTACDKGGDPATPETPTPQMRYVSSVTSDYGDRTVNGTSLVEYDSKNRIVKITSETKGAEYESKSVTTCTYDDVARTVAIKIDDESDYDGHHSEDTDNQLFKLDANGNVISGEGTTYFDNLTSATYADGYLNKLNFTHMFSNEYGGEEYEGGSIITMTWKDGNRTRIVNSDNVRYDQEHSYVGDYEDGRTINLTYNPSWANNPQCNIDLNTLLFTYDEFGMGSMFPELIGMFGKRSKHMISGAKAENDVEYLYTRKVTNMEYDADGFVTKITAEETYSNKSDKMNFAITYR